MWKSVFSQSFFFPLLVCRLLERIHFLLNSSIVVHWSTYDQGQHTLEKPRDNVVSVRIWPFLRMPNKKDLLLFSLQKEPVDPWICSSCRSTFATFALLESHQCINKDRVLTTRLRPPNKLGSLKAKSKFKGKLRGSALGKSIAQCYGTISCSSAAKLSCASSGNTCDALVRFIPKWRNGRPSLLKGREVKQPDSYPCRLCGKIFESIEKLTVHTYVHKAERPYKCSQHGCTKAFISKYKLLRYSSEGTPFLVWGKKKGHPLLLERPSDS